MFHRAFDHSENVPFNEMMNIALAPGATKSDFALAMLVEGNSILLVGESVHFLEVVLVLKIKALKRMSYNNKKTFAPFMNQTNSE
mmetsp:Transcript_17358/g.31700  ORF Transcript_17358/g.31700 Transcript_17358/m.31700 type:complete len:85 (+) Transcript_17358:1263-1517(+)